MGLKEYHRKRDFKVTKEPIGSLKKTLSNLYVMQKHAASHLHYDLRLELDGTLKSWAVPKGPSLDSKDKRLAVHVEDHPIEYGSFEGTIPEGQYGAGQVIVWDKGTWVFKGDNINKAYLQGNLTFELKGKKLKGLWKLVRIKSDPKNWLFFKIDDQYAKSREDYNIIEKKPNSVQSKIAIRKNKSKKKIQKKSIKNKKCQATLCLILSLHN